MKKSFLFVTAGTAMIAGWILLSQNKVQSGTPIHLSPAPETRSGSERNAETTDPKTAIKGKETKEIRLEDYQAKLRDALQITDSEKRRIACCSVIREMCKAGYTEEAWSSISDESGLVRSSQIYEFFANAKLDGKGIESKMHELLEKGYRGESSRALTAYLQRFDLAGMDKLIDSPEFKSLNSLMSATPSANPMHDYMLYFDAMAQETHDPKNQKNMWELAKKFRNMNLVTGDSLAGVISKCEFIDPFERFNILPVTETAADGEVEFSYARGKIVEQMVRQDAAQTVQTLLANKDVHNGGDIKAALTEWTGIEPKAAYDWYAKNSATLTEKQQDGAAAAFFESAVNSGELETAKQWASQIKDESLRAEALKYLPAPK